MGPRTVLGLMVLMGLVLSGCAPAPNPEPDGSWNQATHKQYQVLSEQVQGCRDAGGFPEVELRWDMAGHEFRVLKVCTFPQRGCQEAEKGKS